MEQVVFKVKKMGCGACVTRVTTALRGVPGIEIVGVKPGHAVVRRDPAAVTDEQITSAIQAACYEATREVDHDSHARPV